MLWNNKNRLLCLTLESYKEEEDEKKISNKVVVPGTCINCCIDYVYR